MCLDLSCIVRDSCALNGFRIPVNKHVSEHLKPTMRIYNSLKATND